ncbi:hypothetical protein BB561_002457 [Smittium simulii]|uniref:Atg6 BARA domain-containing protein n=1 Tax=Smittium simulii TaxID=133385 RepID=A0A2T9YQC2_9FUNG|nr:hypothetical protein BB561_002457 [Smittium simulii]
MLKCKKCKKSLSLPKSISQIDNEAIDLVQSSLPTPTSEPKIKQTIHNSALPADLSENNLLQLWSHLPEDYKKTLSEYTSKFKNLGDTKFSEAYGLVYYNTSDMVYILEASLAANQFFEPSFHQEPSGFTNKLDHINPLSNHAPYYENDLKPLAKNSPLPLEESSKASYDSHDFVDSITPAKNIKSSKNLLFSNKKIQDLHDSPFSIIEKNTLDSFIILDKNKSLNQGNIDCFQQNPSPNQTDYLSHYNDSAKVLNANDPKSPQNSSFNNSNSIKSPSVLQNSDKKSIQEYHMYENKNSLLDKTHSILDHPLCVECSKTLINLINSKILDLAEEHQSYLDLYQFYLNNNNQLTGYNFNSNDLTLNHDSKKTTNLELAELHKELDSLTAQDLEYDRTLDNLAKQLETLSEESNDLDNKINFSLLEKNELSAKLTSLNSEIDYLQHNYNKQSNLLFNLQQINVYNDLFTIKIFGANGQITSYDDSRSNLAIIGVINGFRLGRVDVDNIIFNYANSKTNNHYLINKGEITWPEINAAWGQCQLLLVTVARRLNYEFKDYKLIPMGSYSKIAKKLNNSEKSTFEL